MSARVPELVVGGEPRVDLLPPEIRQARKGAAIRRGMFVLLGALLVIVVAGSFGTSMLAAAAATELAAEQAVTTQLFQQQQQYIEVRQNTQQISLIESAERVGSSTRVDWEAVLNSLVAAFPAGAGVRSFTIQSVTPTQGFPQSDLPLAQPRIATVLMLVLAPALVDAQAWVASLTPIAGVAEVTVSSVQWSDDLGGYLTTLTVSVDSTVLESATTEEVAK